MSEENVEKSAILGDDTTQEPKRPLSNASLEFFEILDDVKQLAQQTNGEASSCSDEQYYNNAKKYWNKINADDDGMLGGFASISYCDTQGSSQFLQSIFRSKPSPARTYALDCGAGIGRVSKNLLINFFEKVDLVEQDERFCEQARETLEKTGNLGEIFNKGLQEFDPEEGKYDVIWCQWVLSHLKDDHLVQFYQRCIRGLRKNGMIIIKENVTSSNKVEFDANDFSVTRPLAKMKEIIKESGLRIVREQKQHNFPKGLYPVYILALRPVVK
ncbi:N-terminal Xaa-Pro-Lys N-methyltransferase 1 [Culicoides brevitarsis]|uniref:N-terminal Xaa-Pro-Lys N-methyltransferase 1 n=1 Tax=Culicoides brevitarsis TaxID=469753 RepID=UPI00307C0E25